MTKIRALQRLSHAAVTQGAIQGIGLCSGLLAIHLMSVEEYAVYTLANSMLGALSLLSVAGVSKALMIEGGKVWQNHKALGEVLTTGLHVSRRVALFFLPLICGVLLYLLDLNDVGWRASLIVLIAIIPSYLSNLYRKVADVSLKLHQDTFFYQNIMLKESVLRLLLIALALYFFPFAAVAILCAGLAQMVWNIALKQRSMRYAQWPSTVDDGVQSRMHGLILKMLPGSLYYCFADQINIWLLSVYGSTASISEIGALGRIAMIMSFMDVLFNLLIVPRFARMEPQFRSIGLFFVRAMVIVCILIVGVVFTAKLAPNAFLFFIGPKYAHLEHELLLLFIFSGLKVQNGVMLQLNAARGWIIPPLFYIPSMIAIQFTMAVTSELSTLQGVLLFSIKVSVIQFGILLGYSCVKIMLMRGDVSKESI